MVSKAGRANDVLVSEKVLSSRWVLPFNDSNTLTGPEALTLDEVAVRAGAVLGRAFRFENETVDEAYASRRAAYGAADWQLDAWVSTYTAIADGSVATVTDDVRRVTGRAPRTLEQALRP